MSFVLKKNQIVRLKLKWTKLNKLHGNGPKHHGICGMFAHQVAYFSLYDLHRAEIPAYVYVLP